MATKRKRKTPTRISIPPAAIEAWRRGDRAALRRALGVAPWEPEPFDMDRAEPPEYARGKLFGEAWPRMWQIRQELIRLAGRPGRAH